MEEELQPNMEVWCIIMRSRDSVTHRITSGHFTMDKKFFTKESMKAGSYLRQLLGLENHYSKKVTSIQRDKNSVKVTYGQGEMVFVPDDVNRYFKHVNDSYGQYIEGKIVVSMAYGHVDFIDVSIDLGQ